jgi:hypothetical protein
VAREWGKVSPQGPGARGATRTWPYGLPSGSGLTTLYPRHATPANASLMEALPLTRLVYDNMAIVVTFVYSQEPINRLLKEPLRDFWQHVENFSYEVPRRNAIRACLEIAVLIRLIDDQHKIANFLDRHKLRHFGVVYRTDETTTPLHIRELTNKIIHAKELSWDLSDERAPKLICTASDEQKSKFKWTRAEVYIEHLVAFCGLLTPEEVR